MDKLSDYRKVGFRLVKGWLAAEVLEILVVLDGAQRANGVNGAVAEIGVHHGKFFIALNILQRSGEASVAIDLFSNQESNVDNSGRGDLAILRRNIARWGRPESVIVKQGDSTDLETEELSRLGGPYRLFSIDGGHTSRIVLSDMKLAASVLLSGGVVIADDVFHQEWPGVVSGIVRYLDTGDGLVPFAIGFNKVFFCDHEYVQSYRDVLQHAFNGRYLISVKDSEFLDHEVLVIARVRRTPRLILGRNATAKKLFHRVRQLGSVMTRG